MLVISGIQPTGKIHIGNYFGAIKHWVKLQEKYECFFFIADLHAMTESYNPKKLQKNIYETLASLIALGISEKKSVIFLQSQVPFHCELFWILNCVCPCGDLFRMTQFKEKSKQFKDNINAGLLNYPILMASDILLYNAEFVPVGKDQLQHLEITREIARRFNKRFKKIFKEPKPLLNPLGEKIYSLTNPSKKMSKSSPEGCLFAFDSKKDIKEKILSSITDSGKEIKFSPKAKPGISNLIKIYSLVKEKTIKEVEREFLGKGYFEFKNKVALSLIDYFAQKRKRYLELVKNKSYLKKILNKGSQKASQVAERNLVKIKKVCGLL